MADKYSSVFFHLSTPNGMIKAGWRFERKKRKTTIACLLCAEEEIDPYFAGTLRQLVIHVDEEHPEAARFMKMRGWKQMII